MSSKTKDEKFFDTIFKRIVHGLYIDGELTEEDLTDKSELRDKVRSIFEDNPELNITIDHRDTLIDNAKYFKKRDHINYSKIFYATFFEHSINNIIHLTCSRKGITNQVKMTFYVR